MIVNCQMSRDSDVLGGETQIDYCPNMLLELRAAINPPIPGSFHWDSDPILGGSIDNRDANPTSLVGGTPGIAYQVSVTFTPDGMSTTFGTNVCLCPHAHNPTFGFNLPQQVRLDNDNDTGPGRNENDIVSGYGPHIGEGASGCPCALDNIYVTVDTPDGNNNQVVQLTWNGTPWTLPNNSPAEDVKAHSPISIRGAQPSAAVGDVNYHFVASNSVTHEILADITAATTVLRVDLTADYDGTDKVDAMPPDDVEYTAGTNLIVCSGPNPSHIRARAWVPTFPTDGTVSLTAASSDGAAVRLWDRKHIDDPSATCLMDTSGVLATNAITWHPSNFASLQDGFDYYVQGVTNGHLTLTLAYQGGGITAADHIDTTVYTVDLRIDSSNLWGVAVPPHDAGVEAIKDRDGSADFPGKIIYMNDMDVDGDGIPDFLDGFGRINDAPPGYDDKITGGAFVPLVLDCPLPAGVDRSQARIALEYPAQDPATIGQMSLEDAKAFFDTHGDPAVCNPFDPQPTLIGKAINWLITPPPTPGKIRVWIKNADQDRRPTHIETGGDFVAPGVPIPYQTLLTNNATHVTLYVEGIGCSPFWGKDKITAKVYPMPGNAVLFASDRVSHTVVRCVYKVCVQRPYICLRDPTTGEVTDRIVFRASYFSPSALMHSYMEGQRQFDDYKLYHGEAASMGHAFARVEIRTPDHPTTESGTTYWTGQTGLDGKSVYSGYRALQHGIFWWYRADDGSENKQDELEHRYAQLYDDPATKKVTDCGISNKMLAVREYRVRPETANLLCEYRNRIHPFGGYGLDTVLGSASDEMLRASISRCGCGTYVTLLTQYAGVLSNIADWRISQQMPQVPLPSVNTNLIQMVWDYFGLYRHHVGGYYASWYGYASILLQFEQAADTDAANSHVMDEWGISSEQYPLRRLMFSDPRFMMDWIDGENQYTRWSKDRGVTVQYDKTKKDDLSEWRGDPCQE